MAARIAIKRSITALSSLQPFFKLNSTVSAAWSASSSNRIVFAGRSVMGFSLQSLLYARTSVYRRCISRDRSPRAHSRGEKALTLRM